MEVSLVGGYLAAVPALLLLAASLAFALSGPAAKVALDGASIPGVVTYRCGIAALVLLAFSARELRSVPARALLLPGVGGVILGAHFALFTAGVATTSLPAAVTLVSLEPAVILIAAAIAFGVRPTRMQLVGVSLAAGGALLIARSGAGPAGEHTLFGDALVVAAVSLYGVYYVVTRKVGEAIRPLPYAAIVYAVAALTAAALAVGTGSSLAVSDARTAVALGVLALVPTLIGHTLIQIASRRLPAAWVALISPGETLGSIAVGLVALSALPSAEEAAGCLLVVAGATITVGGERFASLARSSISRA